MPVARLRRLESQRPEPTQFRTPSQPRRIYNSPHESASARRGSTGLAEDVRRQSTRVTRPMSGNTPRGDHVDDREFGDALRRLEWQRSELPTQGLVAWARALAHEPRRNSLSLHEASHSGAVPSSRLVDVQSTAPRPTSVNNSRGEIVGRLVFDGSEHAAHVLHRRQLLDRLLALQLAADEPGEDSAMDSTTLVPPPEPGQAAPPLDAQELSALRASTSTLTHTLADVCTICLEPRQKGHVVLRLGCGHSFHGACARNWLSRSGCCPTCRMLVPRVPRASDASASREAMLRERWRAARERLPYP